MLEAFFFNGISSSNPLIVSCGEYPFLIIYKNFLSGLCQQRFSAYFYCVIYI